MNFIAKMGKFVSFLFARLLVFLKISRAPQAGPDSTVDVNCAEPPPGIAETISPKAPDQKPAVETDVSPPAVKAKPILTIGNYTSVRDAYENSEWFRNFFFEIFEMYGFPFTSLDCYNQKDKVMLSWAMMHTMKALHQEPGLWVTLFEEGDPSIAADFFCRQFFERRGEHMIPYFPEPGGGLVVDSSTPSDAIKKGKSDT